MKKIKIVLGCFLVFVSCVLITGCDLLRDHSGPDYFKVFDNISNFKIEYEYTESNSTRYITEIKVGDTAYFHEEGKEPVIYKKSDGYIKAEVLGSISPFCSRTDYFRSFYKGMEYQGETTFLGRTVLIYHENRTDLRFREYLIDKQYNIVLKRVFNDSSDLSFIVTSFTVGEQVIPTF